MQYPVITDFGTFNQQNFIPFCSVIFLKMNVNPNAKNPVLISAIQSLWFFSEIGIKSFCNLYIKQLQYFTFKLIP